MPAGQYPCSGAKAGNDPQKPYAGNMMLRVGADVLSKAALAAELSGKSLNRWSEEVLEEAANRVVQA